MRVALLFLTIDNLNVPEVWEKFMGGNENKYSIYCHPKYPKRVTDKLLKGNMIEKLVATAWGTIGCVEAYWNLLEAAMKNEENKRFVFVSESCVPLYDGEYFYTEVMKNKPMINRFQGSQERWNYISDKSFMLRERFYKSGAQGMVFDRRMGDHFMKNKYLAVFKNMPCVEEHYWINVLIHDKYDLESIENRIITGTNWIDFENNGRSPKSYAEITINLIKTERAKGNLLYRKARKECVLPIEYIIKR